jgi:prolyl 4-hydroxylase
MTCTRSYSLPFTSLDAEYTAHHDFGFSRIDDKKQGARYATLLLYLNEGMNGGETAFPRWQNAETFKELKVFPEVGKAVLFYSQLPDGNMDDFSHHAAHPVQAGGVSEEKW